MTNFTDLGLDPMLLKALDAEGYRQPTPIQAQAIPPILAGRDVMGLAQTGTGKTAAFALPILNRLGADRRAPLRKGARSLVLSPTRELATQIAESFRSYGRHMGLSVAVVFGGVGHKPQRDQLHRGVDVLVATPGRLIDHMTERNVSLEATEILVLDEADQMMDLGFIRPIRQIISKLSHRRQSLFFSATMPSEIGQLAAELLKDPVKVAVTPVAKTADRVAQKVIHVEHTRKRALLVELFADASLDRAIVFTRTKRGADRVARHLETAGIPCSAIHGNKSQGQRVAALEDFKASRIRALIATDIAARGIDIDAVSHVINYEIPNVPESYVHRIGRTARAGAEGIAISLVDHEERTYLRDIERLTRQAIPAEDRTGCEKLARAAAAQAPERSEGEAHPQGREGRGRQGPGRRENGRGDRHNHPRGRREEGFAAREGGQNQHRRREVDASSNRSRSEAGTRVHPRHDATSPRPEGSRMAGHGGAGESIAPRNGQVRERPAPVHSDREEKGQRNPGGGRGRNGHEPRHLRPDGDRTPHGLDHVRFLQGGQGRMGHHSAAQGPRPDDRLKAPRARGGQDGDAQRGGKERPAGRR